jgi:hypothetical protein
MNQQCLTSSKSTVYKKDDHGCLQLAAAAKDTTNQMLYDFQTPSWHKRIEWQSVRARSVQKPCACDYARKASPVHIENVCMETRKANKAPSQGTRNGLQPR